MPRPKSAAAEVLKEPEPTGYGLGKAGWVSAKFPEGKLPLQLLEAWIDESYRAPSGKRSAGKK